MDNAQTERLIRSINSLTAAVLVEPIMDRMHRMLDKGFDATSAATGAYELIGEAHYNAYRALTRPGALLTDAEAAVARQRAPEAFHHGTAPGDPGRRRMLDATGQMEHPEAPECARQGCSPKPGEHHWPGCWCSEDGCPARRLMAAPGGYGSHLEVPACANDGCYPVDA